MQRLDRIASHVVGGDDLESSVSPLWSAKRLSGALGVEVTGVDLRTVMGDPRSMQEIQRLLNEHLLLCVRGQTELSPAEQLRFTEYFGPCQDHPLGSRKGQPRPEGVPEVVMIIQNIGKGTVRNDIWHSDLSCMEKPVAYTVLRSVCGTPGLGDTCFSNQYKALDTLSAGMRRIVEGIGRAVHNSKHFEGPDAKETFTKSQPDTLHPLLRTHPLTGKRALFLAGNFIERFENMSVSESTPILDALIAHSTKPENVYRHRWMEGDLVMWDNRCTMHYAVFDYPPEHKRFIYRTTANGERPF